MDFQQTIKLKLRAFDHRILDKATGDIVDTISRIGARYKGPVPMPRKISRFTVNRSTHVDKKSREQFEIRDHSRLLIIEASPQTVDALMKLDISAGVDIQIKMKGVEK
ncbi:30S ribosomal protein S10 [Candidatus Bandiella euplotis]|uniref:Small ribosomal subunit protein uS10 n=1 Tax=Candidatus Bandiella euplotis TaxID=1664265 RepID=A0ABZ0UNV6_9RICK|nr:30S ribosomal protein S10 [Candidatus Bandiella woodruffii]WPX96783.1 30S ribosomal protein S10 [Candidatus Bandiella woodruffii]